MVRRPRVSDPEIQRALDGLVSDINSSEARPPFGQVIEVSLVAATEKVINHGLGVPPTGWQIIDRDANANIWRSSDSTSTQLRLTASADVNVKVWVY